MNDHRAAGQELQSQVIAAARKGQQRAQQTVRQMTSAAQQIRPHLANLPRPMSNLPRPTINLSAIPGQAQLRERAPELAAKLHGSLPSPLQSRVPSPDQVKSSAQQFAGHARSVQRSVVSQVRSAASPLAQQAASRLSQISGPADQSEPMTTKVSHVTVTRSDKAKDSTAKGSKPSGSTPSTGSSSKPSTSTGSSKPSTSGSGSGSSSSSTSTSGSSSTSASKSATPPKPSTRSTASGSSTSAPKPRSKPTDK